MHYARVMQAGRWAFKKALSEGRPAAFSDCLQAQIAGSVATRARRLDLAGPRAHSTPAQTRLNLRAGSGSIRASERDGPAARP